MDIKKRAEEIVRDYYIVTERNIEQALKQVREETIQECLDIARRHAMGPQRGVNGSYEADLIQQEIRELKGKA